jgi:hypothetical protein
VAAPPLRKAKAARAPGGEGEKIQEFQSNNEMRDTVYFASCVEIEQALANQMQSKNFKHPENKFTLTLHPLTNVNCQKRLKQTKKGIRNLAALICNKLSD